jgi:hypothetical protein
MTYDKGFAKEVLDFVAQGNSRYAASDRFMIPTQTIKYWIKKQKEKTDNQELEKEKVNNQRSEKDLIN